MDKIKAITLTYRVKPELKELLLIAAAHEHRSIANMVEVMIRDYCDRNGIHTMKKKMGQ
jgi:predicted HicB family RNase H-like nuclease